MNIQLSDHFNYKKLLRFALPSIIMMVVGSLYSVVDGLFVSNFVGKTPFASINLIMPFLMISGSVGFMLGTGGSALVAKTLGEGDKEKANSIFSLLIYSLIVISVIIAALGLYFVRDISVLLGAEGAMIDNCVRYGSILIPMLPVYALQYAFQSLLVTAERPNFGLYVTIGAGVTNIVLDALFIIVLHWGLEGAAYATAVSEAVGGLVPLFYFIFSKDAKLRLGRTCFDGHALLQASTNGMSEFMSNISMSVVALCYNFQLMRYAGEDGVAAYGVIQYITYVFFTIFIGYSMGTAPIVSYHYGAGDTDELHNLFSRGLRVIGVSGIILCTAAELSAGALSGVFVGYDAELHKFTTEAFMIYSVSFLLAGFNIWASSFFTALNNGIVSAVISVARTLVCETGAVIILPLLLGINGIWLAASLAEIMALTVSASLLVHYRAKYKY